MEGKTRQANFEILRILAMLMVISLHYIIKGNITISLMEDRSFPNLLAWFLQSCCIVAVNVYVFITGYFLIEAKWSLKKLISLVIQVWCYSVSVPVLCFLMNVGEVRSWNLYHWATVLFPFQMEHYWFATAYLIMYLFSPVLKAAIRNLGKRELEAVIFTLLLFFSVGKSLIPIQIPTDRYGYDFGWFLCLSLIAGYLRIYGIPWFNRIRKGFLWYLLFTLLIFGYSLFLGYLSDQGFPLSYAMDMNYSYNHILVLLSSLGLFYGFKYVHFARTGICKFCCKIAPYTFGVYLLHENLAIRMFWPSWLGVERVRGTLLFLPHMVFSVAVIFFAGIIAEYIRSCLFQLLESSLKSLNGKRK